MPDSLRRRRLVGWLVGGWLVGAVGVGAVGAETLRDPFIFGSGDPRGDSTTSVLVGVLWDTQKPVAVVGERSVVTGQFIGDWEVVEIRPEGIVVQRGVRQVLIEPGQTLPGD